MATPQEVAVEGMKEPLLRFHACCEGDVASIAGLLSAMSGQQLPPPIVCSLMNIDPDALTAQVQAGKTPSATEEQFLNGMRAALDDNDTAEMYLGVIEKQITLEEQRRANAAAREKVTISQEKAEELQERLLEHAKADEQLRAHLSNIRHVHDAWRESAGVEPSDPSKFPSVVASPQVVAMEGILKALHSSLLSPEERLAFSLAPEEEAGGFLVERLAAYRQDAASPLAASMRSLCSWLAGELTGETLPPDILGQDSEVVRALDAALAASLSAPDFQAQVSATLGDVSAGPASARIAAVEAQLCAAMAQAKHAHPLTRSLSPYAAVVWFAAIRALSELAWPHQGQEALEGLDKASRAAVKAVRRKIGDRFFRKKWLPLESNPEVFNGLGRQLGLPAGVEFYEVFGLDPDLLAMVPGPVEGVLVCFPLTERHKDSLLERKLAPLSKQGAEGAEGGPYFMQQSVPNACGTVALIHATANLSAELSPTEGWLADFVSKTKSNSPSERACALEEDEGLAQAHNATAQLGDTRVQDFGQGAPGGSAFNEVLHFICFVHHQGVLYELDGLSDRARGRGATTPATLLADTAKLVLEDLQGDMRVNLMALAPAH